MIKKIIIFLLICIFLFVFFPKKTIKHSFYHWQNTYNIKDTKEKLYIKVLDVDFSNRLELIKTSFNSKPNKHFVLVVYITNKAMRESSLPLLVNKISKYLNNMTYNFDEIQFDCDWSISTRAKYFEFLEEIKRKTNKKLSATIRLHQIKYAAKTGIPPVDYGLLMYYNMAKITDYNTKNSILDNEVARKYHFNFDTYPLKLKLALPLYSQAVQFRNKKAISIFEGLQKEDFKIENFSKLKENYYKVNKSFYFRGRYVYTGDVFRFEDSKFEDIQIAMNDFFEISKNPFDEVIFYTIKYKNKYDLNKLKGRYDF